MVNNLFHHFKRALSNLKKALLVNVITVFTIVISMLLLGGYFLLLGNVNDWISLSDEQFTVRAFLHDKVSQDQTRELVSKLENRLEVSGIEIIQKQQARTDFLKKYPDFADVLEAIDNNPFPNTVVISLKERKDVDVSNFARNINSWTEIESVDYGERWLEQYIAFRGALKIGSYILASLIILACIFLVSNTIRLNIFTRKDEIDIYQLVGGTRLFIAAPFLIEGLLLGFLGFVLSVALLYFFFQLSLAGVSRQIAHLSGGLQISFLDFRSMTILLLVGLGAGFFGSLLSLRRFLKV